MNSQGPPRQETESPIELALRLLGPEWLHYPPSSFAPPDYASLSVNESIFASGNFVDASCTSEVAEQCRVALERYEARQRQVKLDKKWQRLADEAVARRQQSQESADASKLPVPRRSEPEGTGAPPALCDHDGVPGGFCVKCHPAACDDCGAAAPRRHAGLLTRVYDDGMPSDLCFYCFHRRSLEAEQWPCVQGNSLDKRIAAARATIEAEQPKRGAHDWQVDHDEP